MKIKYEYKKNINQDKSSLLRCLSPKLKRKLQIEDTQNEFALPSINNKITRNKIKNICENKESYESNDEAKVNSPKSLKEANTKLNMFIRDKCKVLIHNLKGREGLLMKSYRKLKKKSKMLSMSPKRKATDFVLNLRCISKESVIANQNLLSERAYMREQLLKNLNLTNNNKELTEKVFNLCIRLKNQHQ